MKGAGVSPLLLDMANKKRTIEEIKILDYYMHFTERLMNVVLAQFEWNNLPDTVDRWYMERTLLYSGQLAMYIPKDTDMIVASNFTTKSLTMYGYPASIVGVTTNGYSASGERQGGQLEVDDDDFVVMYDTMTRTPLYKTIDIYAKQLTKVALAIDLNLQQQYTPYVLVGNVENRAVRDTFKRFMDGVAEFNPAMMTSLDPDEIKTIDLNVQYKGKDLEELREKIWANAMSELGVNGNLSKKERVLNDELILARQENQIKLNSRLMNRIEFCNKVNEKFGLDISVNLSVGDIGGEDYDITRIIGTGESEEPVSDGVY